MADTSTWDGPTDSEPWYSLANARFCSRQSAEIVIHAVAYGADVD